MVLEIHIVRTKSLGNNISRTGYEACGYSFVLLGYTWPKTMLSVLNTSLCSHVARI